jgi:CheY-like chemotaxis protein
LTGNAGMAGLGVVSHISAVFEALLKDVCETPAYLNACSLQTISQTLEFLNHLIALGTSIEPLEMSRSTVLVVDDEAISRRVMMYAVDNAHMNPVCVRSSHLALQLLEDNPFTVVVTDIDLPEMNGFELCTRLRELPVHKETPVIFVTVLSNFEHRAYSVLSGGNDLVTKPILLIELTVKLVTIAIQKAIARRQKRPEAITR